MESSLWGALEHATSCQFESSLTWILISNRPDIWNGLKAFLFLNSNWAQKEPLRWHMNRQDTLSSSVKGGASQAPHLSWIAIGWLETPLSTQEAVELEPPHSPQPSFWGTLHCCWSNEGTLYVLNARLAIGDSWSPSQSSLWGLQSPLWNFPSSIPSAAQKAYRQEPSKDSAGHWFLCPWESAFWSI